MKNQPQLSNVLVCPGAFYLVGCTPTPEADKESLGTTQMGFEGNSDLLPRLLIDGGGKEVAREGGEGEAEGEEERLSPSEFFFEVSALVKQRETRREMKDGGCYSAPFRLLCFNFRRRT